MSNHGYHIRNSTLKIKHPNKNQIPQQSNVSSDHSSDDETSQIARLESRLLSRFDLCVTFPDIDFSNNHNDYSGDPADKSLQSSY